MMLSCGQSTPMYNCSIVKPGQMVSFGEANLKECNLIPKWVFKMYSCSGQDDQLGVQSVERNGD